MCQAHDYHPAFPAWSNTARGEKQPLSKSSDPALSTTRSRCRKTIPKPTLDLLAVLLAASLWVCRGPSSRSWRTISILILAFTTRHSLKMADTIFYAESQPEILPLEIRSHFNALTDHEKAYAHWMSR